MTFASLLVVHSKALPNIVGPPRHIVHRLGTAFYKCCLLDRLLYNKLIPDDIVVNLVLSAISIAAREVN